MLEWFHSIAVKYFLLLQAMYGVETIPPQNPHWKIVDWQYTDGIYKFQASSTSIAIGCQTNPNMLIVLPSVVQGAHELFYNQKLIMQVGSTDFSSPVPYYASPSLKCSELEGSGELLWVVRTNSQLFARVNQFPHISSSIPVQHILGETIHVTAIGSLLFVGLLVLLLFAGRVSNKIIINFTCSCLFLAIYCFGAEAGKFNIDYTMLNVQRYADLAVALAIFTLTSVFLHVGILSKKWWQLYAGVTFLTSSMILVGSTGDSVQFGISFGFTPLLLICCSILFKSLKKSYHNLSSTKTLMESAALSFFTLALMNDILFAVGLIQTAAVLPIGFLSAFLFIGLSVNQEIVDAYKERDFLRKNLEEEVERKTTELNTKSKSLEATVLKLQAAQAELIQSEKLASLGTLSAGIAHEINNSLNYVNASLPALEKMIKKIPGSEDHTKIWKLVDLMKEGLKLTFDIIRSLKNYAGLNHAEKADIDFKDLIRSIELMLKSRLTERHSIRLEVEGMGIIFGSIVSLNQIFMNLIVNSIDALEEGGEVYIKCSDQDRGVEILVKDDGMGIPEDIQNRIFDPFFTTKKVGQGTGLGMHIIKKELERHEGTIELYSVQGEGTEFKIFLPYENYLQEAA